MISEFKFVLRCGTVSLEACIIITICLRQFKLLAIWKVGWPDGKCEQNDIGLAIFFFKQKYFGAFVVKTYQQR